MASQPVDVVIIGGGPAGCSAALTLARQGVRTALLEAKTYPHHKVCGEFLSPECASLLDRLGVLAAVCALKPVAIDRAALTAADGTRWESALPGTALGISRSALDAALAEQAQRIGVELHQATRVTRITGSLAEGFEVCTHTPSGEQIFRARAVIAAHGKRSSVDRALNRRFLDQRQPYIGLKTHFRGPALPARIELHTFPGGYCGMSENEEGMANVALLARQSDFQQHGAGSIEQFIQWMQTQNPYLCEWLSQAEQVGGWLSIGEVPFVRKRAVVNDVLMAGDSAGLIAPLAGDGIAMALHGGQMAADHLYRCLLNELSPADTVRSYSHAWRSQFSTRLRLSWMLQPLMFRPAAASLALRLIRRLPVIGRALMHFTRDMRLIKQ